MFKKNKFKILFCNIVFSSIFFAAIPMEDRDPTEGVSEFKVLYPAHPFCYPDGRVPEKFSRKIPPMPQPGIVSYGYKKKLEKYEAIFDNIFIQSGCNKEIFLHDINKLSDVFRSLQHFPYHISKRTHPNTNFEVLPEEINNLFMQLAQCYSRLCGLYETLKHLFSRQDSCVLFKVSTINQIQMVYRDINSVYTRLNEIPIQSLNNTKLLNCIIDQHYGHLRSNLGKPLSAVIIRMLNGSDKIYKKYELLFNNIITDSSHIKCLCGNACDRPISVRYSELNFPAERDVLPVEIFEKQKREKIIETTTTTTQSFNVIPAVEFKKPKANPKPVKRKRKKKSNIHDVIPVSSNVVSTTITTTTTTSATGPEEAAIKIQEESMQNIEQKQPTENLEKKEQDRVEEQNESKVNKKTRKTQARKKKKQERKRKEQEEINKKAQEEALLQAMRNRQKEEEASRKKNVLNQNKETTVNEAHRVLVQNLGSVFGSFASAATGSEENKQQVRQTIAGRMESFGADDRNQAILFKNAKANLLIKRNSRLQKYSKFKLRIVAIFQEIADLYDKLADFNENINSLNIQLSVNPFKGKEILDEIYIKVDCLGRIAITNGVNLDTSHPSKNGLEIVKELVPQAAICRIAVEPQSSIFTGEDYQHPIVEDSAMMLEQLQKMFRNFGGSDN